MSKKSAASLSVVPSKSGLDARLPVPKSFTARQKELWLEIVASKPASWFDRATAPLLVGYVKAIASHEILSLRSDALESGLAVGSCDLKTLNRVHAMVDRQGRLLLTFATKLRLTNQARYTPATAAVVAGTASGTRPWDETTK